MDMRPSLSLAVLLLLTGCLANNSLGTQTNAQININRLQQVSIGMTQEEVFQIMRYPAIEENVDYNDLCFDIWFYVTRVTVLDQSKLMPRNLTPLIFKDGILVAKGYDYYNYLLNEQKGYEKYPSRRSDTQENEPLEEALKTPAASTAAPQKQQQKKTPTKAPQTPKTPQKQNQNSPSSSHPQKQSQQQVAPEQGAPLQPVSPTPVQPPPPAQPQAGQQSPQVSMSSKPQPSKKHPEANPEESTPQKPEDQDKKGLKWSEEDKRMQEQSQEQNFDYW